MIKLLNVSFLVWPEEVQRYTQAVRKCGELLVEKKP